MQRDPRVSHHFTNLAMDKQIEKQIAFMSHAFGISLNRRVKLILENRIEFWDGEKRVSNLVALRALQQFGRE